MNTLPCTYYTPDGTGGTVEHHAVLLAIDTEKAVVQPQAGGNVVIVPVTHLSVIECEMATVVPAEQILVGRFLGEPVYVSAHVPDPVVRLLIERLRDVQG